jgi:hypothetical protein
MGVESEAVRPPWQSQDRKLPATVRSADHHLVQMRTDIALPDPQESGEHGLEMPILAPVPGGD